MKNWNEGIGQGLRGILTALFFVGHEVIYARAGGGGGGGHSGGGGSSSGGFSDDFSGGGSGGSLSWGHIFWIVGALLIYFLFKAYSKNKSGGVGGAILSTFAGMAAGVDVSEDSGNPNRVANTASLPFPEGLTEEKVKISFMGIQDAWQAKNLKKVRRWISDGVYQRFTGQFIMMNKLVQINKLTNIKIDKVRVANVGTDGNFQTADVAIHFKMDDEFLSEKYPQFNEKFKGESATEYWTFIKKKDTKTEKNLYGSDNCPNCGATFDTDLGEISRCGSCGTLTNNATFDWVLSEITQEDDYSPERAIQNMDELLSLTANDPTFSTQKMEDIASNVFMQVMQVMGGEPEKKLKRFAMDEVREEIMKARKAEGNIIFDRLYLNEVTLSGFSKDDIRLQTHFYLKATYQRVRADEKISLLDKDLRPSFYTLTLSKNRKALQAPTKEVVYSYECPGCGAPYTDTTDDKCSYCGAEIIDYDHNWILTAFKKV